MTFVAKLPPMAFPLTASSQQMAQMQAVWAAQQAQLMAAAESALRQAYARSQQEAKQESMAYHLQHKGGMPASIANNSKLIRYNPFMLPPVEAYNNFSADQKAGVSPPWIDPSYYPVRRTAIIISRTRKIRRLQGFGARLATF